MSKSSVTREYRQRFINKYGVESLRALAAIKNNKADLVVSRSSAVTYRGNLTRGVYEPFVSCDFRNDRLNLTTFRG